MYQRILHIYLSVAVLNIFCITPVLNAPFFNLNQGASAGGDGGGGGAAAAQDYGHMAKKLMNEFFEENEFSKDSKIKPELQGGPEEDASDEKRDFGTSEEMTKDDRTEQRRLEENKVALFFHVLIEILKEIFEDTSVKKESLNRNERPVQKIKISETPLTTVKAEEKILETTVAAPTEGITTTELPVTDAPTTTVSTTPLITTVGVKSTVAATTIQSSITTTPVVDVEAPHLSKINIPQLPTEAATESPEEITVTTPTSTTPLISFEVPELQKFGVTVSPTKATVLIEETTTVPPSVGAAPTPLISFEVPPQNSKVVQIPTKEISEASATTTTAATTSGASTSPPPSSTTSTTTTTPLPSTLSTTEETHYEDTDENGIPFWLKVIDGIRCSMRDCTGVLIPTRSPYDQKELKNLTMTRFIREHGLPPCPCLELKELQKVLSSSNKKSDSTQRQ